MKKLALLVTLLTLLTAACTGSRTDITPSVTASQTLPPTATLTVTITPRVPTFTPTLFVFEGLLTIKVNVRSGPGTGYDSLGQLDAGEKIRIVARDSPGTWYMILYPAGSQERGWVAAQYVTLEAGTEIPVFATSTPAGPTGRVIQRLNVRSGPGVSFDTIGLLEVGVQVSLTGKNPAASWFQIDFPSGPGGHGWVTSQYIQTDSSAGLPVLDDYGAVVTPGAGGTPLAPILAPTPTIGPAPSDGDSLLHPAVNVTFSSEGTGQFVYSSQVSVPEGDAEDWLQFTPFAITGTKARLNLSLACTGNGSLTVEIWQAGVPLSGWGSLACGDHGKSIQLPVDMEYTLHITPIAGSVLQLVGYTITVQNQP